MGASEGAGGALQVSFNYLVMFVPADYAGYTITRNSIGGNRGAGVVIKAPGGTVTNNLISSPKYWGVQARLCMQ